MKPDWKDAPEWANWLALDSDGAWWWYKQRPDIGVRGWVGGEIAAFAGASCSMWDESLEASP